MNIILWLLSLKRQSTLQALSTPTSRFHELLASPRRARACSHCHLRNFLRFLEAKGGLRTGKSSRPETAVETSDFPGVGEMQMEAVGTTTPVLPPAARGTQSGPGAASGGRGLPGPAGRNRTCGSSYLCRNTGFRRKPSVGELDAPSVPTYCSTYRARCCGDRGRQACVFTRTPEALGGWRPEKSGCAMETTRRQLWMEQSSEPESDTSSLRGHVPAVYRPLCVRHVTSSHGERGPRTEESRVWGAQQHHDTCSRARPGRRWG